MPFPSLGLARASDICTQTCKTASPGVESHDYVIAQTSRLLQQLQLQLQRDKGVCVHACMQVPQFTVNRERSGRVLHSFTGLSPHHEIALEPTEWRDAEECDDGRSLILWTSRTPGITLSMHRRPDGTFSGVFGGNQDIFKTIDREAADKAPEAFRSSADAEATLEQRKADVHRWIQAWRQGRSAQHGGAAQEHAVQQKAVELRPVDVHRAHAYSTMLCKAFAGLPEDWAEAIAQQV